MHRKWRAEGESTWLAGPGYAGKRRRKGQIIIVERPRCLHEAFEHGALGHGDPKSNSFEGSNDTLV